MKKNMFIVFLLLTSFTFSVVTAQTGKVVEKIQLPSSILKTNVNCSIYFPPDYDTSNRSYPVLYLLHGYTDNETAWVQFGEVNSTVDKAIAKKEISPVIIVMPDAGVTWYMNDINNKEPYEDMFIKELIPYIDSKYRTRAKKEFRAIGGLSMGGFGSLLYSMKYPDTFVACIAFSAAVRPNEELIKMDDKRYNEVFGKLLGPKPKSLNEIPEYWKTINPIELAKMQPVDKLNTVGFYLDCGDDDYLIEGNTLLNSIMNERKIKHEFRVRDGVHNWTYWRENIIDGMKFITKYFRR